MKSQLKSCLISRILSLVGAAILLIPVMAHALPPPALMPAAGVHVITTDGTDTLKMPAAPTGPINVVTPLPRLQPARPAGADLSVTKMCALDPTHGPQAVYCAVTIHNNGSAPSGSPVTLTDNPVSPPPGTLYTSSSGTFGCTAAAGPVSGSMPCNYNGSIAVGQDGTTFFYFQVPQGGTFKNCASATQGGGVVDPNPANNSNICATVIVPPPSGGPINVVTPPPSGPCVNQVVVSGIHYPNQSCSQTTPGFLSNMMTMFHFTSKCLPPNHLLGVTNVTCQNAPITGFPNGSVYQGTACCGISPPHVPDLSVTKTCQVYTPSGQVPSATCTVTVTNNGPGAEVLPLTLTDTLTGGAPGGTTISGAAGGYLSCPGGVVGGPFTCHVPNIAGTALAAGQHADYLISFKMPAGGTYQNCVTVTQGQPEFNTANNTSCTTFTFPHPATGTVTVRKVVVAPPGDTGKFTLQLFNGSGGLLANFLNGGNGATMTSGPLPAGNYSVGEVAGNNGTSLSNYTSVISGAGCGANGAVTVAAGSNIVCTITNTRASLRADLSVTKSCALDPTHGPQAVYCVVNVTNMGPATSGNPVTVTDSPVAPPGGATFTSSSGTFGCPQPSSPIPVPPSISCTSYSSLATGGGSGSSGSTFYYFQVPQGGSFRNCASATQGGGVVDPNPVNNSNICATVVVPPPATGTVTIAHLPMQGGNQNTPCPQLGVVLPRSPASPYLAIMLSNLDQRCGTMGPGFKLQTIKFLTCAPDPRGPGFGPNATADITCGP